MIIDHIIQQKIGYIGHFTFLLFKQNDYGWHINESTCTPVKPSHKSINGEKEAWVKYTSPSGNVNEMRVLSKSICSGFSLGSDNSFSF